MARPSGAVTRMEWDTDEQGRIQTIKSRTGIKNTPDIVRLALMEKYQRMMGSPDPNGGKNGSKEG